MGEMREWALGPQPVSDQTLVDLEYSGGERLHGVPAGEFCWSVNWGDCTIVKWRAAPALSKAEGRSLSSASGQEGGE